MLKKYLKKIKKAQDGYTIIETMVSVSLFLVVVIIGMTAILNANLVHKKSQDMRSIIDNLSFVMEDMSKNMRTGKNFYCITGSDSLADVTAAKSGQGCWGVAFESQGGSPGNSNDQWVYYIGLDNSVNPPIDRIWKATQGPYGTPTNFISLTTDEISINPVTSSFNIVGAEAPPSNNQQPFATIRLSGTITYKGVTTPFSLQTSVSQRLIDS